MLGSFVQKGVDLTARTSFVAASQDQTLQNSRKTGVDLTAMTALEAASNGPKMSLSKSTNVPTPAVQPQ
eukprot:10227917-Karenia_brevis.AAC.1